MTSLTIVTPWKNKRAELERDYFAAIRCADAELLIVDDGSDPPLPNGLRPHASGFAPACNTGLRAARTDAVLFLNNDIVPLAPDWIEPIRDALEPGVLVGDLINAPHAAVDGVPMPYISGWCLAGMTDDLLELGGFDEEFEEPSYYGDNDLCFRARLEGMRLRDARVPLRHLQNRTIGTPDDPRIRAVTLANKARFEARVREALGVAA
jgi:glycosyltransferase involved in cell wall biosynthesis